MNSNKIAQEVFVTGKTKITTDEDHHEILKILRPGCTFDVSFTEGKVIYHSFFDPNGLLPPTLEEIKKEQKYQEECKNYYQYAYDRCHEYPDGFEQLDMLWNAVNQGIDLKESEWFKTILQIKHKYPKPDRDPPKREN